MQANLGEDSGEVWRQVAPALNDAIGSLREKDRIAIVLRFLKGMDYKHIAAALGASEEAAQMRVSRALEKLRRLFAKRGVVLSAATLGGLLTVHGTQAAPVGLAASVAGAAVQASSLTVSNLALVKATMKIMAWTKLKFAVGAGIVVLLAFQHHQNSLQAQQLAATRGVLRARLEAVAAQETRIAELEQQTAAILETRRDQEQALARLRARPKASAISDRASPMARASTTLLSATLRDPTAREALRDYVVNSWRNHLDPLIRELQLSAQDAEKLVQLGGDWSMKDLDAVAAFTDGKMTAQAAVQAGDEDEQNATNQVRSLLGETGFAKYQECELSYPARSLVEQFDKQLGFFAIHQIQRQRLFDIIAAEPYEVATGLAGDFTTRELVSPEELNRRFEQKTEAGQQILQSASAFLNPGQLEALDLMLKQNLSTQRRDVPADAQKALRNSKASPRNDIVEQNASRFGDRRRGARRLAASGARPTRPRAGFRPGPNPRTGPATRFASFGSQGYSSNGTMNCGKRNEALGTRPCWRSCASVPPSLGPPPNPPHKHVVSAARSPTCWITRSSGTPNGSTSVIKCAPASERFSDY